MFESRDVVVEADGVALDAILTVPPGAPGIVVFAHGSGSSRLSPRNQRVAAALQHAGLGTLLFDLLTPAEGALDERTGHLRFDIPLLGRRVIGAVDWLSDRRDTHELSIGTFGASTGAAAALIAAAQRPRRVLAVVSRGGRPDLAGDALGEVSAHTLLVVGSLDETVLRLNRVALAALGPRARLLEVPGATHLFEEPGTLDQVIEAATGWFVTWLRRGEGI